MSESTYRRILVRAPNWLGDAVHSLPAIHSLRRGCPEAELTVLTRPPCAEVYQGCPDVSDLIVLPPAFVLHRLAAYRSLRSRKFDLAVLFPNSFESALMSVLAGVPERIGYRRDFRSFLLTRSIDSSDRHRIHRIDYYMKLVTSLGLPDRGRIFPFHIPTESDREAETILKRHGVGTDEPLVGIHFGAAFGSAKAWPVERYAALSDQLAKKFQARVLVFGGRDVEPLLERFRRDLQSEPILLIGQTTVKTLAALVRRCGLFVSHDTGPLHLAYALGTPTISIFGPTLPEVSRPEGENHVTVYKGVECSPCWKRHCPIDHRCMERVSVEEILELAETVHWTRRGFPAA
jgi:heptosyltransferase-2